MAPSKKHSAKNRPAGKQPAKKSSASRRPAEESQAPAAQAAWKRDGRIYLPPPGGYAALPFSSGVFAGDTFYVAGHIGFYPETLRVLANPDEEARLMLDGVRGTLAKAGLAMDDIVSVQIFCSDVSLFDRFNAIYRTYFTEPLPARAFLGAGPLLFGARYEICATAVRKSPGR